ncbi:UNVERIFIED_CONTAM: GTP-binding protein Di-Ras2 [Trichonephila clavipes]
MASQSLLLSDPPVITLIFFLIAGMQLKVTFLDTAGDLQFPAMRRLSIANGQAFLLVYSIDSEESFRIIKQCFEEIREQKPDFQELPIMVSISCISYP